MKALIPYCGSDASEGQMGRPAIRDTRAVELRDQGLSYSEIGRVLAREEHRQIPYIYISVWKAVKRGRGKKGA